MLSRLRFIFWRNKPLIIVKEFIEVEETLFDYYNLVENKSAKNYPSITLLIADVE